MGSDEEEKAIAEQVGKSLAQWAEDKEHLERETALYHVLRRERNYQILQAASRMVGQENGYGDVMSSSAALAEAIALLEEIEGRNP
jgi:hypothetical protein